MSCDGGLIHSDAATHNGGAVQHLLRAVCLTDVIACLVCTMAFPGPLIRDTIGADGTQRVLA
jgi:hypothetical protein